MRELSLQGVANVIGDLPWYCVAHAYLRGLSSSGGD
jgi:hypothetical protein